MVRSATRILTTWPCTTLARGFSLPRSTTSHFGNMAKTLPGHGQQFYIPKIRALPAKSTTARNGTYKRKSGLLAATLADTSEKRTRPP